MADKKEPLIEFLDELWKQIPRSKSKAHPDDSHALNDWHLYGPKDDRITDAVYCLAEKHGARIQDIEDIILRALLKEIDKYSGTKE